MTAHGMRVAFASLAWVALLGVWLAGGDAAAARALLGGGVLLALGALETLNRQKEVA